MGKIADNLLNRNFKANKPNEKWAADITECKVRDKKLYLSPIVDLFNGEIISFNLSRHPNFDQVLDMLKKAFERIPNNNNLIFTFRSRMAISNGTIPIFIKAKRYQTEYVKKRQLFG